MHEWGKCEKGIEIFTYAMVKGQMNPRETEGLPTYRHHTDSYTRPQL